jgi:hypothetical protein
MTHGNFGAVRKLTRCLKLASVPLPNLRPEVGSGNEDWELSCGQLQKADSASCISLGYFSFTAGVDR